MKTFFLFFLTFNIFAFQNSVVRGGGPTVVSSLPTASTNNNRVYIVTDGASSGDCTVGGGSIRAVCISNGVG